MIVVPLQLSFSPAWAVFVTALAFTALIFCLILAIIALRGHSSSRPPYRLHERGADCWCEPVFMRPCPVCFDEDTGEFDVFCWKCRGNGFLPLERGYRGDPWDDDGVYLMHRDELDDED